MSSNVKRFLLKLLLGGIGSFIINHSSLKPEGYKSCTEIHFLSYILPPVGIVYHWVAAGCALAFDPKNERNIGYAPDDATFFKLLFSSAPTVSSYDNDDNGSEDDTDENKLFESANRAIMRGQEYAKSGYSSSAISSYSSAAEKIVKLMNFDRAYYQKHLYAVYDEMGTIYYQDLHDYSNAYKYFTLALNNCRECADREPYGSASRDVDYITSRLNSAKSSM